MLEEVEQIQKKGYPGANVWNIQKQKFCKNPDLIIANLVAEKIGLQNLIKIVKESRAKYISVLIWDKRNKKCLSVFMGEKGVYHSVTEEEVISAFQENWLDLIYMKDGIEVEGVFFIRLDFRVLR